MKNMLRVCAVNDGARSVLATFTDRDTMQKDAILWVDDVLRATTGFCLLSRLNDIQAACRKGDKTVFPDKFAMPLCIVNLAIKEFNLEITEE
jgi:hypothetical protein